MLDRPAWELARAVRAGELAALALTRAALARIEALDPELGAFLSVHREAALAQAEAIDEAVRAGRDPGPLAGVPVALKDNLCTLGAVTTCGSRMLERFVPPYEATAVARLRQAGAVLLGKTNMDEFGMGSSTERSAFGPTRNPWDLERVPGGSSGGSAAAVAAGMVAAALGSDTGGSIRQPAAFCGLSGLKPTYGRVSRHGLVAYASSLDQVGPMAREVRDCALLLQAIAGHDPADATSSDRAVPDYVAGLERGARGIRFGIPRASLGDLGPDMARAFEGAAEVLGGLGAGLVEIDLPRLAQALPTYYILAPAEASSNLARYDGIRYGLRVDGPDVATMSRRTRSAGFGAEVKRRIMLGTYTLSAGYHEAYYGQALKARAVLQADFRAALERVDVILMPTAPGPAFPLGERGADPLAMYLSDVYTVAVNLAGLPALSIPCGRIGGLPVGLQLIGRAWEEGTILACGHAYQQAAGLLPRPPALGLPG